MKKEFTKIFYYYCNSDDIFFELYLSGRSYICFTYEGRVLIERDLLPKEVELLNHRLNNLRFNFSLKYDLLDTKLCPDIESRLVLYKNSLKIDVTWKMSDLVNDPYFYQPLEAFVDMVHELAPIDSLGIELPIFQ